MRSSAFTRWKAPLGAEELCVLYNFDGYLLDTERRELRLGSKPVEIEPQVFDILLHLIRNQDRVASGAEFFDTVWQGRKAVGGSGTTQKLVKTLPRKGYRFIGQAGLWTIGFGRASLIFRQ